MALVERGGENGGMVVAAAAKYSAFPLWQF